MYTTSKDTIRVTVVSGGYRIEGDMHVVAGSRLTDALNSKAKEFFAMTDVVVRFGTDEGETLYESPYLAVNRRSIDFVFPIGEARREPGVLG